MIQIHPELPADYPAVFEINALAFGREAEARLVEALRAGPTHLAGLSLVAEEAGCVVGHILFTRVYIHTAAGEQVASACLAPMAVRPEWQRRGVGGALVRTGLAACRAAGETNVNVLGHPEYYPRFGFVRASRYGITCEYAVPEEAFMVQELQAGALAGVGGVVRYPVAFEEAM
jgi:putative acetyltransferase